MVTHFPKTYRHFSQTQKYNFLGQIFHNFMGTNNQNPLAVVLLVKHWNEIKKETQ